MDGHKHSGALTDETLERDVEGMLAVEPSPDFLARVRTRVADAPAPMSWRLFSPFRWVFVVAAVAVVIVAGTVVWRSLDSARAIDGAAPTPLVVETPTPPAAVNPTEVVSQPPQSIEPVRRGPDLRRARRIAPVSERSNLVAVVAPEDARAFERLLASLRRPDVVLVLSTDTTGPVALSAPSIEIAPIDIEPVPPIAQLEGGVE
ncbi:MAG TPA: hypothetical protein VI485_24270 [Vicinamibacterales bacterium]|nr:hypothetical protein [Vicinamibacterales bacterium]